MGGLGADVDAGRAHLRIHELFLNTGRALLPSAPVSAFAHIGTGNNIIYVDPEHDMVAVMRWIEGGAADGFVRRLLAALAPQQIQ